MRIPKEPATDRRRKGTNSFVYNRVKRAIKPFVRKRKADGLILSQLIREEVVPSVPEAVILSLSFQKPRKLIDVRRPKVPAKQVSKGVQGSVKDGISRMEALKRELFTLAAGKAVPEHFFQIPRAESFRSLVPTAK